MSTRTKTGAPEFRKRKAEETAQSSPKTGPAAVNPLTDFIHPVCATREVRTGKPHRFFLGGVAYVLWRDKQGKYHCVADECPHRRASLACGHTVDDAIYCPYHRWRVTGNGKCTSPSDPDVGLQMPAYRIVEHLDYLWMGGPGAPGRIDAHKLVPQRQDWSFAGGYKLVIKAPLEIVSDNFSENEHVPWVHSGLGWDERRLETIDFRFDKTDDGASVEYRARQRPNLLFRLLLVATDDLYINRFESKFEPPHTTYDIAWETKQGTGNRPLATASTVYFVPETKDRTALHLFFQYKLSSLKFLAPFVRRSLPTIALKEANDDRRFLESVMADAPPDLNGLKLRKYDRPIALHRKLIHERYLRGYEFPR